MSEFSYIVRAEDGSRKEGQLEAKNYNAAAEQLQSQQLVIIKLSERDASFDFMGPFLERLTTSFDKLKNSIPLTTIVFFTRQLSTMFSAGLTVEKALFFLAEYANMILISALTAIMFLGGWLSPLSFIPDGIHWFLLKTGGFLFLFLWFRATFPRYRYDQIMRLGWKIFLPITIVWVMLVAAMVVWQLPPWFVN